MSSRSLTRVTPAATRVASLVSGVVAVAPSGAAAAHPLRSLHLLVRVDPDRATTGDVVGDLQAPRGASRARPAPAIPTTNGFGGSDCPITLDDPVYDGVAGSRPVSSLGGAPGIATTGAAHTAPGGAQRLTPPVVAST